MTMDDDTKRFMKASILSTPIATSKYSFWFYSKYAYIPLALVIVIAGGFMSQLRTEPKTEEVTVPTLIPPQNDSVPGGIIDNSVAPIEGQMLKTAPGTGGGINTSPGSDAEVMSIPATFMAPADPASSSNSMAKQTDLAFSVNNFLDGYDKNSDVLLTMVLKNESSVDQTITFNNGCMTFYIVDSIDSRNGQLCTMQFISLTLAPGESHTWEVSIPFSKMDLSFGTHVVTVGISEKYKQSKEIVLE